MTLFKKVEIMCKALILLEVSLLGALVQDIYCGNNMKLESYWDNGNISYDILKHFQQNQKDLNVFWYLWFYKIIKYILIWCCNLAQKKGWLIEKEQLSKNSHKKWCCSKCLCMQNISLSYKNTVWKIFGKVIEMRCARMRMMCAIYLIKLWEPFSGRIFDRMVCKILYENITIVFAKYLIKL